MPYGNREDLSGKRFGDWFVVLPVPERRHGSIYYACSCVCGEVRIVAAFHLRRGATTCCGCRRKRILVGGRYGNLVVQERHGRRRNSTVWRCACDCGNTAFVVGESLHGGCTRSCGCLKLVTSAATATHGMTRTPTYRSWNMMWMRCVNEKMNAYPNYGGRGISVCERWEIFEHFLEDMRVRPPGTTLDRINNDGNYEPGNCRWATPVEQRRNARNLVLEGKHEAEQIRWLTKLYPLRDVAAFFGCSVSLVGQIGRGMHWQ